MDTLKCIFLHTYSRILFGNRTGLHLKAISQTRAMNQSNLVVTYTFIFRVLASQAHTCRLMAVTYYCWKSGPKLIENLYLSLKNFNQNDSLNYWSEPAWKQKSSKKHSGDPHYNNHINKLSDSCFFFLNSFSKIVTMRELCDVRKVHKMFHGPYHVLKVICLSPLFSCLSLLLALLSCGKQKR